MKTTEEIEFCLEAFTEKYGLDALSAAQGSTAWLQLKLGVLSASNASKIVAKKDSATRWTYIYDLVAQVASGVTEEINSKYLDYGKEHESAAQALYELTTKKKITTVPFVYKSSSFRYGCSPDGIIDGQHGLELKVPFNPTNYVKFLCAENIEPEYMWQVQYSMWILGCDTWDFAMYSPVMKVKPMKIVTVKKDLEKHKVLDDMVPQFSNDMELELLNIGLKFGDQWDRLKVK